MINKILCIILCASIFSAYISPKYSTTAVVTVVGAKIKTAHKDPDSIKYKRKDCPVCKGKGWYMSGDDIEKIECQYCEPDHEK